MSKAYKLRTAAITRAAQSAERSGSATSLVITPVKGGSQEPGRTLSVRSRRTDHRPSGPGITNQAVAAQRVN